MDDPLRETREIHVSEWVDDDNTEHEWVEEMPKHTRAHQAKHDDDRLTTMMTRHPVFRRDRKRKNRRRNARPRNAGSKTAGELARDRSLTWVVLSEGRVSQNFAKMRNIS